MYSETEFVFDFFLYYVFEDDSVTDEQSNFKLVRDNFLVNRERVVKVSFGLLCCSRAGRTCLKENEQSSIARS